ncbi:MAG: DUF4340 domain-containing protein [Nannocystales bacterium]
MKSAVIGYGLALTLALGGAYQTWTHEGDPDLSGSTVILDVERADLEALVFESPTGRVRLELREDELGPYVWALTEPVAKPEPEPESPSAKPVPAQPQAFKAGAAGETIAKGSAPFVAKRVLEGIDGSKLEELGFGDEQASLTFHRKGRDTKTYEVGAKAYGGSNRYIRDPADGTVYIVAASLIDSLETADRSLPDRSLLAFDVTDIDTISVRGGEAEATYVQNNPDDRAARFWSTPGSSDPSPAAAGWFDKALRLKVLRYIEPANKPTGLQEAFSMTVSAGRKSSEAIIYRAAGEDGNEAWYASSTHNRALVQLQSSSAAEAQADLASVLDVEP